MAGRLAGKRALATAAGQGHRPRICTPPLPPRAPACRRTDIADDKRVPVPVDALIATRRLDVTDDQAIVVLADELGAARHRGSTATGSCITALILTPTRSTGMCPLCSRTSATLTMIRAFLRRRCWSARRAPNHQHGLDGFLSGRRAESLRLRMDHRVVVIGLTNRWRADFITEGIRCNAICPEQSRPHRSKTASQCRAREWSAVARRRAGVCRAPALGPARHARGSCSACSLSRLG